MSRYSPVRMRPLLVIGVCVTGSLAPMTQAAASIVRSDRAGQPPAPCIAMLLPTVTSMPGRADDVGKAVRDLFASYLTAPAFKTIPLEAKLPALAMDEARQKDCPNVLTVTLSGKQGGKGSVLGKLAGQAGSSAIAYVPGSSSTAGAIVRGAAVGTAYAVSSIAAATKARDEVKLDYKVQTLENVMRVGPGVQQAKAQVNGEDILTPVVERAAADIANALLRR
jgi:hypothetical protein